MIHIKEITYPDGTPVKKLNLVSSQICLSKMEPAQWDSLFDKDNNPTPEFDFHIMDCFFTLTSVLQMVDKDNNKIDTTKLKVGEKIKYMGDSFEIYDTDKMSGLFEYIIEKTGALKTALDAGGIN